MRHPVDLDVREAGAALRTGHLSSTDLVQASLDRIEERDPEIGAFVHVARDEALRAAAAADSALSRGQDRGPLHGIPFAVKDVFDVTGWPVRFGCAHYRDRIADRTADAVASAVAAGAIPLGIVATYELATVGPDSTSLYPQPRNPWNRDHVTGGSSSGSAAAVAAGMVRFALGSDTGGSARSPAAYCGIVGFKPTAEMLSRSGLMPLAPSMDQVGILTASALDAAEVFAALSGASDPPERRDWNLAFGRNWCEGGAGEKAILPLMDDAASALSLAGARINPVQLPPYAAVEAAGSTILLSEQIASHWARLEGDPDHVGKMAYRSLKSGLSITPTQLEKARRAAEGFAAEIDTILSSHDALILPTTMTVAPRFSEFETGEPVWTSMRTIPFNLSGHPALSVPIGLCGGLPLGMQIVGAKGADGLVLALAAAYQAATDHQVFRAYPA